MIKRKNQHAQEENRYQIVEFLKKKKGTQKEASELFGISLKTVSNTWKKYKEGKKITALQEYLCESKPSTGTFAKPAELLSLIMTKFCLHKK